GSAARRDGAARRARAGGTGGRGCDAARRAVGRPASGGGRDAAGSGGRASARRRAGSAARAARLPGAGVARRDPRGARPRAHRDRGHGRSPAAGVGRAASRRGRPPDPLAAGVRGRGHGRGGGPHPRSRWEAPARPARDQQGLNGQGQGVLPLMGAGQAVLEQLRALAARQRALAEQLERMQAQGISSAAGPLAQEARELARQLEAGRLDQRTIERQQRLYHRLLDAGRTLSNEEPDQNNERMSRAATGDSVHVPAALKPGATGAGPRLRYPTWDELQGLTPEERRLVLDYFRRLNAPQQ